MAKTLDKASKDCLEQNTFFAQIVRTGFKTGKKYNFSPLKNNYTI